MQPWNERWMGDALVLKNSLNKQNTQQRCYVPERDHNDIGIWLLKRKGIVYLKMKILSLITHPNFTKLGKTKKIHKEKNNDFIQET